MSEEIFNTKNNPEDEFESNTRFTLESLSDKPTVAQGFEEFELSIPVYDIESTKSEFDTDSTVINLDDESDAEDISADFDFYDDDDEDEEEIAEREDEEQHLPYMQNRELSWLTFNERVLDQGADESVPLLERLNFISIFWSNLQEFFMVRVGSLTDLSYIEPPVADSKTGMTPNDQIKAIHERCHELYPIQESTYEHVRGQLAKEGIRHLRPEDLSEEQRNYLFGLVKHNIEPFLSPQIINSRHPFPHLENGKLYILVRLDDEASQSERKKKKKKKDKDKAKKEKGGAEGVVLGLIPLPHQCERVIKLPGRGFQFILLEHALEMFVPEIFSMYKIKHTNVICVTRNADIDANQTGDEQDDDYREHMKRLLKQRARLAPVRLECERPLSPVMEKLMLKKLSLKRSQVYDTTVPLDLSFTWELGSRISDKKREKLSNKPFTPAWPANLDRKRRIIDQVAERDIMLSYPYDSIDPFVQLLREAANDPDVISIKITLYRLANQSHIAEALIAAADAGKEVTALFELRARFDENNNIEWSQRFEQAGCNVLYGFRDYKVHSKICSITRRTADGSIQHITQLGTGNYNEKTARLYTDFSFITVDEDFARDAVEFFRNMQLENISDNYEILSVAPLQIKQMILDNLGKQIERARAGLPANAFMKANSITDKDVLEKISEASNAGVRIILFIRGICCLIPRIKGATENVRVVSIVGRLLEHSRIYCFGPAEDCVIYLSSADLMTRNLNKRVEIAWPLPQGEIHDMVLRYIDTCMHDTAKLRELRPNATYTPLGAFCDLDEEGNPEPAFDAQLALIKRAAEEPEDDDEDDFEFEIDEGELDFIEEETEVDEEEEKLTDLTIEEILSPVTPATDQSKVSYQDLYETILDSGSDTLIEMDEETTERPKLNPDLIPIPTIESETDTDEEAQEPAIEEIEEFDFEPEPAPEFEAVEESEYEPEVTKEPEPESEPEIESEAELESKPELETEPEPEPAPEFLAESQSEPDSEPTTEAEPEPEPLEGSEPATTSEEESIESDKSDTEEAVPTTEEESEVETIAEEDANEPDTPGASDRVSELIAQLSPSPEQSMPLQESPIHTLQSLQPIDEEPEAAASSLAAALAGLPVIEQDEQSKESETSPEPEPEPELESQPEPEAEIKPEIEIHEAEVDATTQSEAALNSDITQKLEPIVLPETTEEQAAEESPKLEPELVPVIDLIPEAEPVAEPMSVSEETAMPIPNDPSDALETQPESVENEESNETQAIVDNLIASLNNPAPASSEETAEPAAAPNQEDEEMQGFFDGPARSIEMPPDKKQGLFEGSNSTGADGEKKKQGFFSRFRK